jgi:hypothetical protein
VPFKFSLILICPFLSPGAVSLPNDPWYNFFMTAGFGEVASSQHAATFKTHEMELDMIPEISHELLLQMGFTKAGPRIKILRLRDAIFSPKTGESTSWNVSASPFVVFSVLPCLSNLICIPLSNLCNFF